ncbi:MAG: ABC transporter permease, partial [Clostridia bacterium]
IFQRLHKPLNITKITSDKTITNIFIFVNNFITKIIIINATMINKEEISLRALKEYNIRNLTLEIRKEHENVFSNEECAEIEKLTGEKFYKIFNENLPLNFGEAKDKKMFPHDCSGYFVAEEGALKELDCKLLAGKYPQTPQEITLTKYLFDYYNNAHDMQFKNYDEIINLNLDGFNVVGVVDTNFTDDYSILQDKKISTSTKYYVAKQALEDQLMISLHSAVFVTEDFLNINNISIGGNSYADYIKYQNYHSYLDFLGKNLNEIDEKNYTYSNKPVQIKDISKAKDVKYFEDGKTELSPNEILLSENEFKFFLNNNYRVDFKSIKDCPKEITDNFYLDLEIGISWENSQVPKQKYKVVGYFKGEGVVVDKNIIYNNSHNINAITQTLNDDDKRSKKILSVSCDKVLGEKSFFGMLLDKDISSTNRRVEIVNYFGWIGGALFAIIVTLMLYNFLFVLIEDKTKQIGILRCLGASKLNINLIFLNIAVAIALISFALASVVSFFVNKIFYQWITKSVWFININTFSNNATPFFVGIIFCAAIIFSSVVKLFFVVKNKPINLVRKG